MTAAPQASSARPYHHGDLASALVAHAMTLLESGEPYSMRAVARRAGVSPAAPYRHFSGREALDEAVAVEGFRTLVATLQSALAAADTPEPVHTIANLNAVYVRFAVQHPAVYRLMFAGASTVGVDQPSARDHAATTLHEQVRESLERLFPGRASADLSRGLWGMAHGLASLHLDGTYPAEPVPDVDERVRSAVIAVLGVVHPATDHTRPTATEPSTL